MEKWSQTQEVVYRDLTPPGMKKGDSKCLLFYLFFAVVIVCRMSLQTCIPSLFLLQMLARCSRHHTVQSLWSPAGMNGGKKRASSDLSSM